VNVKDKFWWTKSN